jgi:hypothetical protein
MIGPSEPKPAAGASVGDELLSLLWGSGISQISVRMAMLESGCGAGQSIETV